ncbi:LOW QUALITY PROTEIN: intraflagellar transport protein 81 homolog [Petromyzon marinus]|uniref:LOW QUALITY PROTEIN: intraflagellar transport protein 81 homolog n=1 Tax=Petromyzon marinus TaxID=7757 RepID=UPI003F708320
MERLIVERLNADPFRRNLNLISLDALPPLGLLQLLSDVLAHLDPRHTVDVREESPDQTALRLLGALKLLKYKPPEEEGDRSGFRQGLVAGDKAVVHSLLAWLLPRLDELKKRAYLGRFLQRVDVPAEHLQDPALADAHAQYEELLSEFTSLHKAVDQLRASGFSSNDIRKDIAAMEEERETLEKRVERLKRKGESVSGQAKLLEAVHGLRVEREREETLTLQKSEQRNQLFHVEQRLQRSKQQLQDLRQGSTELSPESVLRRVREELNFTGYIGGEKLPGELARARAQVQDLQRAGRKQGLAQGDLDALRGQIDEVGEEVSRLLESRAMAWVEVMMVMLTLVTMVTMVGTMMTTTMTTKLMTKLIVMSDRRGWRGGEPPAGVSRDGVGGDVDHGGDVDDGGNDDDDDDDRDDGGDDDDDDVDDGDDDGDVIDEVGEEVSRLLEGRMRRGDPGDDKLVLFRQQAAIISRKRAARAEELQEARESLQEMEHSREARGGGGRRGGGDEAIGGDEFKRYVARLRSKNTVYKRQKQQLWDARAELGVLTRTRDLLAQKLSSATQRLLALEERRGVAGFSEAQDDLEKVSRSKQQHDEAKAQTLGDMSHMVRELNALITEKKAALSPVIKELRPLRQHCQELGEEYERRKSQYEICAAGLEGNRSQLEQEVRALREEIRLSECHYHFSKQQSQMVQVLLDRAGVEMRAYVSPDPHERKRALREQYNKLILEQENVGKKLRELQRSVRDSHVPSLQQVGAWRDAERLLLHKLQAVVAVVVAASPRQPRRGRSPPGPAAAAGHRQAGRGAAVTTVQGEVQEERLVLS